MHILDMTNKTEADWANEAMVALELAGLSFEMQLEVQKMLEAILDEGPGGEFVMRSCLRCDYSHGPGTMTVRCGRQVCRVCGEIAA